MILRIRYPVSGEVNDVRLAVTLPALTRISTSPSGSTSAETVSAKTTDDIDDTAAAMATTTATATPTGLRLMPSAVARRTRTLRLRNGRPTVARANPLAEAKNGAPRPNPEAV